MNRTLIALALIAALACAGLYAMKRTPPAGNGGHEPAPGAQAPETRTITLYYYNPEKDRDADGNIQCTAQGLVAVERSIASTQTPLKESVELLLEGALTPAEAARPARSGTALRSL